METGRKSDYTEALANLICSRIADGQSLRKVCSDDDMPSTVSVYAWFRIHDSFLNNYMRAKTDSADSDADKIEDVAERVLSGDLDPQAARVAIDAWKWTAGKKRPKKYGDKIMQEISGSLSLTDLTDEQLVEKLKNLEKND